MAKDKDNDLQKILIGTFSTNIAKKASLSILKLFTETVECLNVKYEKNIQLEFIHKILNSDGDQLECKNVFFEINLTSKNTKIHNLIDCYIIFFDLENDKSLVELEKILLYLKPINSDDNKIYLINFYMNKNNIKSNLTEDNIKLCFEKYELENYEISLINLENSNDDLVEIINSISIETLGDKNYINKDLEENKCKSKCNIY